MANKIGWCDETLNIITGCTAASEGCANCYAKKMAYRQKGRNGYPADNPFAVTFHPDKLLFPDRWKKPKRIFLNSMGDWMHPDVEPSWVTRIVGMMIAWPQHKYQTLTKRPERLIELLGGADYCPQLHLGVTVELQKYRERIEILNDTPACVRFVSFEPLLGPIGVPHVQMQQLDQIIIGAETGPGARHCRLEWIEWLVGLAKECDVPVWVKTVPGPDGKATADITKFPKHLQLRQEPRR